MQFVFALGKDEGNREYLAGPGELIVVAEDLQEESVPSGNVNGVVDNLDAEGLSGKLYRCSAAVLAQFVDVQGESRDDGEDVFVFCHDGAVVHFGQSLAPTEFSVFGIDADEAFSSRVDGVQVLLAPEQLRVFSLGRNVQEAYELGADGLAVTPQDKRGRVGVADGMAHGFGPCFLLVLVATLVVLEEQCAE